MLTFAHRVLLYHTVIAHTDAPFKQLSRTAQPHYRISTIVIAAQHNIQALYRPFHPDITDTNRTQAPSSHRRYPSRLSSINHYHPSLRSQPASVSRTHNIVPLSFIALSITGTRSSPFTTVPSSLPSSQHSVIHVPALTNCTFHPNHGTSSSLSPLSPVTDHKLIVIVHTVHRHHRHSRHNHSSFIVTVNRSLSHRHTILTDH